MDFNDSIFDLKLKINKLSSKNYLIRLGEIKELKTKFEKTMNLSPRLAKNRNLLELITSKNKIKDLEEIYQFHRGYHPECNVLPKIRLEIKKRKNEDKQAKIFPVIKQKHVRQANSITPNPRSKYSNHLMINPLKTNHSRNMTEIEI